MNVPKVNIAIFGVGWTIGIFLAPFLTPLHSCPYLVDLHDPQALSACQPVNNGTVEGPARLSQDKLHKWFLKCELHNGYFPIREISDSGHTNSISHTLICSSTCQGQSLTVLNRYYSLHSHK